MIWSPTAMLSITSNPFVTRPKQGVVAVQYNRVEADEELGGICDSRPLRFCHSEGFLSPVRDRSSQSLSYLRWENGTRLESVVRLQRDGMSHGYNIPIAHSLGSFPQYWAHRPQKTRPQLPLWLSQ